MNIDIRKLQNKVVVITGATAGLGRATAIAYAEKGAKVMLLARGKEGLAATMTDISHIKGIAKAYSVDVSNSTEVKNVIDEITDEFGGIDILINNAMCSVFAPVEKIHPDEFKRVTEVVYLGQVYTTMAVLEKMKIRNSGKIIFIGSALSYRGVGLQSAYCGAKHAIKGFFEALRCELSHDKSAVSISMIQLPAMNTPQFGWVLNKLPRKAKPMGKVYQPEVAVRAILFASLTNRREIYVGWPTFQTIIANTFLPGFLDWYLGKTCYDGQQTGELNESRASNVFSPIAENRGAHGSFDNIACESSFLLWITFYKYTIYLTVGLIGLISLIFIFAGSKLFA